MTYAQMEFKELLIIRMNNQMRANERVRPPQNRVSFLSTLRMKGTAMLEDIVKLTVGMSAGIGPANTSTT
jgi:hypothetical protein